MVETVKIDDIEEKLVEDYLSWSLKAPTCMSDTLYKSGVLKGIKVALKSVRKFKEE